MPGSRQWYLKPENRAFDPFPLLGKQQVSPAQVELQHAEQPVIAEVEASVDELETAHQPGLVAASLGHVEGQSAVRRGVRFPAGSGVAVHGTPFVAANIPDFPDRTNSP